MPPQSTLIIQLQDGLGNQMFQYAHGVAMAKRFGTRLKFDRVWFEIQGETNATPRRYGLDCFQLTADFISKKERDRILTCFPWKQLNEHNRLRIAADKRPFGPVLLWDSWNWRNHRVFDGVEEKLRLDFSFAAPRETMSLGAQTTALKIQTAGDAVMLHVRRGDYVGNHLHDVCNRNYYLTAVDQAAKQISDPAFFVFSDDIPWCKHTFANMPYPMEFHESSGDEREDLRLMSMCKHHILPNSTFSWWATWLGRSPKQKVFCPDRWFADDAKSAKAMADLVYSQWIKIQTTP